MRPYGRKDGQRPCPLHCLQGRGASSQKQGPRHGPSSALCPATTGREIRAKGEWENLIGGFQASYTLDALLHGRYTKNGRAIPQH
jgi:hypothetical protein